ncbi:MAG: sporulation integral membrane protein YtvI [Clostridia bacterium]|nr:sporulation integral membrane protein YtvI [Clostridia bacterium]
MSDTERKRKAIINTVYYGMLILGAVLALRYGLGLFLPIILAFIFATILQRPKNFLTRRTFLKKGFAAVLCVFIGIAVLALLVSLVGVRVAGEVKSFIDYIIIRLQDIESLVAAIETMVYSFISKLPRFLESTLRESTETLFVGIREYLAGQTAEVPEQIGSLGSFFNLSWITKPLSGVVSTATKVPSFLIASLVCVITTCFMTADYEVITDFINAQLSEKNRENFNRGKALLKSSLGKMGKAYLLIMLVTFSEMLIGLSVLKLIGIFDSSYIVIISVVTAIVDIIPVLGTGTVLIPWAIINLILGNYPMAIGLGVLYAAVTVIRQIVEPKLVAGQLGLPPFVTIAALYIGLKTMGVLGMFIAPVTVIMLKLLNDEGIIHLWKSSHEES